MIRVISSEGRNLCSHSGETLDFSSKTRRNDTYVHPGFVNLISSHLNHAQIFNSYHARCTSSTIGHDLQRACQHRAPATRHRHRRWLRPACHWENGRWENTCFPVILILTLPYYTQIEYFGTCVSPNKYCQAAIPQETRMHQRLDRSLDVNSSLLMPQIHLLVELTTKARIIYHAVPGRRINSY